MSEPVELNKVDLAVRELMLNYPLSYPSRKDALRNIFLSGNHHWNDAGELVRSYEMTKDYEGPIDISDLDQSDEAFSRDDEFNRAIRLRNELDRRTRLFMAENIDMFAKYDSSDGYNYRTLDDYRLTSEYAPIATAPFGSVDPEWLSAMEDFIRDLMVAFNQVFGLHCDQEERKPEPSMYSRMPEAFQQRYDAIKECKAKCEAQSGREASELAFFEEFILPELNKPKTVEA